MSNSFRLFSYCIPYDDGAAPNPFWGTCTLTICKPVIRRVAEVNDWIVGTGSKDSPIGDVSGKIVYAMKVTRKMPMADYFHFAKKELPEKIPDWGNDEYERRVGDAIYDFNHAPPRQLPGVHGPGNVAVDLGGNFSLLSDHFYYFGDQPVQLPSDLMPIVKQGQGHRSTANAAYAVPFVKWLESLGVSRNGLLGRPQLILPPESATSCGAARCASDQIDEQIGDCG